MLNRFCRQCGLRLSVADAGSLCMFCVAPAEGNARSTKQVRFDAQGRRLCRCGRAPIAYRGKCRDCSAEQVRQWRARKGK